MLRDWFAPRRTLPGDLEVVEERPTGTPVRLRRKPETECWERGRGSEGVTWGTWVDTPLPDREVTEEAALEPRWDIKACETLFFG